LIEKHVIKKAPCILTDLKFDDESNSQKSESEKDDIGPEPLKFNKKQTAKFMESKPEE